MTLYMFIVFLCVSVIAFIIYDAIADAKEVKYWELYRKEQEAEYQNRIKLDNAIDYLKGRK